MAQVVVEYDENSCVWLVDSATKARVPLAHGTLLEIGTITPPRVPVPQPYGLAEELAGQARLPGLDSMRKTT